MGITNGVADTLGPATVEFGILFHAYAINREPVPECLKQDWYRLQRIRSYAEAALLEYL